MKFLEKNLEDIIFETDNKKLFERGLPIFGKKLRQVRIGNYGIADIISVKRCGQFLIIDIIELKKDNITIDTLIQSLRYLKGIKHYLRHRGFEKEVRFSIKLCGSSVSNIKELCLLCSAITSNNIEFVSLYTYDFKLEGMYFNEEYESITESLIGEFFKGAKSRRKEESFNLF